MNTPASSDSLSAFFSGAARFACLAAVCGVITLSASASENLVPNGNLETPNATKDWAANWPKSTGGKASWQAEGTDHFIRLEASEAGKMAMIYRQVPLHGAQAVELTVRVRVTGLVKGVQPWFDARIMASFRDPGSKELAGSKPKAISFGKDTEGWVERKVVMNVPLGAESLAIMPTLLQVEAGMLDITEVTLKAVEPVVVAPAAP